MKSFIILIFLFVSNFAYSQNNPYAINIISATYGGNVGAPFNNAIYGAEQMCYNRSTCNITIYSQYFGDPSPGNPKDFQVNYTCGNDPYQRTAYIPSPVRTNQSNVFLNCDQISQNGINIISATYGGNVGAPFNNAKNGVEQMCYNRSTCDVIIYEQYFTDPASGYAKDFQVNYTCGNDPYQRTAYIPSPVRTNQSHVFLNCDQLRQNGINIISATYGGNVGAPFNNAKNGVEQMCYNRSTCNVTVYEQYFTDPASGYAKDFLIYYTCGNNPYQRTAYIPSPVRTNQSNVFLNCN